MGNDQELAEERLLRLIEAEPNGSGAIAAGRPIKTRKPMALFKRHPVIKRRDREDSLLQKLRWLSRVLWVVLIGLGAYVVHIVFMSEAMNPKSLIVQDPSLRYSSAATPEVTPLNLGELDVPLADLVAAVTDRNPFTGRSAHQPRPVEDAVAPVKTARQRLQEITQNLKIVGIDHGSNPLVIIEDLSKRRTFFLNVGEQINGVTISEVSSRGVVMTYEGVDLLLQ